MVEKRAKKLELVTAEQEQPVMIGPEKAELLLVGWGSTLGVLKEVVESLVQEGIPISLMHFQEIWPFPMKVVNQQFNNVRMKKIFIPKWYYF